MADRNRLKTARTRTVMPTYTHAVRTVTALTINQLAVLTAVDMVPKGTPNPRTAIQENVGAITGQLIGLVQIGHILKELYDVSLVERVGKGGKGDRVFSWFITRAGKNALKAAYPITYQLLKHNWHQPVWPEAGQN